MSFEQKLDISALMDAPQGKTVVIASPDRSPTAETVALAEAIGHPVKLNNSSISGAFATTGDAGRTLAAQLMFPIGETDANGEIKAGDMTLKVGPGTGNILTDTEGRPTLRGEITHPGFPVIDSLNGVVGSRVTDDIPTTSILSQKHMAHLDEVEYKPLELVNERMMSPTDVKTRLMPSQPNRATRRKAAKRAKQAATKTTPTNGRWFQRHR